MLNIMSDDADLASDIAKSSPATMYLLVLN